MTYDTHRPVPVIALTRKYVHVTSMSLHHLIMRCATVAKAGSSAPGTAHASSWRRTPKKSSY
eukprot:scaffold408_cov347-Pavlova_lutheri.AAC.37